EIWGDNLPAGRGCESCARGAETEQVIERSQRVGLTRFDETPQVIVASFVHFHRRHRRAGQAHLQTDEAAILPICHSLATYVRRWRGLRCWCGRGSGRAAVRE